MNAGIAETAASVRDRIGDTGYAVLRGLLPPEAVALVRRELAGVYRAQGWLAPGRDPSDLVPDRARRDGAPGWFRFAEDVQRLESFHRLAHHPALAGAMEEIVGGRVLNHPRRHLTAVNPGFWVPPHQEYTYVQGTVDFFTAFVPLTEFGPGTARLRVLRETGGRTVRPLRVLDSHGVQAETGPAEDDWEDLPVAPGDVVVLHSLAVREITENLAGGIGLAALYRFQSRRLPVVKASLKPEHYPRLPDWDRITSGWSSRRWILPPLLPRMTPYRLPEELETWHEVLPPPRSSVVSVAD
ncbi:phytanoyl-CoA dioxygenase family protein [Spirillospora sp. NPDC050679]